MSSRRKSSTPCMVRVVSELYEKEQEEEDPDELMMQIETFSNNNGNDTTDTQTQTQKQSKSESESESELQSVENKKREEKEREMERREIFSEIFPESKDAKKKKTQTFTEVAENSKSKYELFDHEQDLVSKDQLPVMEDIEEETMEDSGEFDTDSETKTQPKKKIGRDYECKYCPFSTKNLEEFKEHVDEKHPSVILNPLYVCSACDFSTKTFDSLTDHNESRHPGETNFKFKRAKKNPQDNQQTILEQTIEVADKDNADNDNECEMTSDNSEKEEEGGGGEEEEQGKKIGEEENGIFASPNCISTSVTSPDDLQTLNQGSETGKKVVQANEQIPIVNINGTVIIPAIEQSMQSQIQGLSHVTPMLKRPPNFSCVPQIAVPLNTTKYNPSLDESATLISSFNKFPYPTHAELSWLTAASKHPEDQIKVWFTTQRLKQGITWSPDEVEEARKKMFNGSIPPAHHTFTTAATVTALPTSSIQQLNSPLKPSQNQLNQQQQQQQPFVYTSVRHPGHSRTTTTSNGFGLASTTSPSSPSGFSLASTANSSGFFSSASFQNALSLSHKRTHVTSVYGPESKRPIMAVAPNPGDPKKDKVLMAPPPPPPPPPAHSHPFPHKSTPLSLYNPMDVKRSVAATTINTYANNNNTTSVPSVTLMPPPPPSLFTQSKAKVAPLLSNSKIWPVVSMPSITFPDSLTRPLIVPPPIYAPQFKNSSLLIPYPSSHTQSTTSTTTATRTNPKEFLNKSHQTHRNHNFPHESIMQQQKSPPPFINPQVRRPPIIQSISGVPNPNSKSHAQGFHNFESKKMMKEQQGVDFTRVASYNRGDKVLTPLMESNGASRKATDFKWSHHNNNHNQIQNGGMYGDISGVGKFDFHAQKSSVLTQFPLLERMKGKTAEQLKILEENFLKNGFPTRGEVDELATFTKLSHAEIESWFVERRALRDNLEQALLNSMGTKRNGSGFTAASFAKKRLNNNNNNNSNHHQNQPQHQMNGSHKSNMAAGGGGVKSPVQTSQSMTIVAPSIVQNSNSCAVPTSAINSTTTSANESSLSSSSSSSSSSLSSSSISSSLDILKDEFSFFAPKKSRWPSSSPSPSSSSPEDFVQLFHGRSWMQPSIGHMNGILNHHGNSPHGNNHHSNSNSSNSSSNVHSVIELAEIFQQQSNKSYNMGGHHHHQSGYGNLELVDFLQNKSRMQQHVSDLGLTEAFQNKAQALTKVKSASANNNFDVADFFQNTQNGVNGVLKGGDIKQQEVVTVGPPLVSPELFQNKAQALTKSASANNNNNFELAELYHQNFTQQNTNGVSKGGEKQEVGPTLVSPDLLQNKAQALTKSASANNNNNNFELAEMYHQNFTQQNANANGVSKGERKQQEVAGLPEVTPFQSKIIPVQQQSASTGANNLELEVAEPFQNKGLQALQKSNVSNISNNFDVADFFQNTQNGANGVSKGGGDIKQQEVVGMDTNNLAQVEFLQNKGQQLVLQKSANNNKNFDLADFFQNTQNGVNGVSKRGEEEKQEVGPTLLSPELLQNKSQVLPKGANNNNSNFELAGLYQNTQENTNANGVSKGGEEDEEEEEEEKQQNKVGTFLFSPEKKNDSAIIFPPQQQPPQHFIHPMPPQSHCSFTDGQQTLTPHNNSINNHEANSNHGSSSINSSNNGSKMLEMELGWLMAERTKTLNNHQQEEEEVLQDSRSFAHRFTEQSGLGFSWFDQSENRENILERDRKLSEDKTGRLTG